MKNHLSAPSIRMPLIRIALRVLLVGIFSIPTVHANETGQTFCPIIGSTDTAMTIQARDGSTTSFNEISGLAMSPTQVGPSGKAILFGINDSGGGERLGVFDSGSGQQLLTLQIPNSVVTNTDWESMTIGSCGATGQNKTCIYIADVGDNRARLSSGSTSRRNGRYQIIKIEEPLVRAYNNNDEIPAATVSVLNFRYTHESSPTGQADCEAVFLDHVGWGDGGAVGDLYLVTKWDQGADVNRKTRLFKFPTSVWLNTTDGYRPEAVGNYDGGGSLMGITWTGADSSFDGTLISFVGYTTRQRRTTNYLFLRCPGSTVAEALAAPNGTTQHCLEWTSPVQGKLEALAWNPEGTQAVNIPEGDNVIGITNFIYDAAQATFMCPEVAWVVGPLGTFCETVVGGIRKPDEWCLAALPNATSSDDGLDSLQGELDLEPRPTAEQDDAETTEEKEDEEEPPHDDTRKPPKTPIQTSQDVTSSATLRRLSVPATLVAFNSVAMVIFFYLA